MGFIHIFVGTFDVCVGANESMLIKKYVENLVDVV